MSCDLLYLRTSENDTVSFLLITIPRSRQITFYLIVQIN